MAQKGTPTTPNPTSKTTPNAQKKKAQQEQNQAQPEASQKKGKGKQREEDVPQKPQQVSKMPSKLQVIKRRRTGIVSGSPFDVENLSDQFKRKFSPSSNVHDLDLWEKLKNMAKRLERPRGEMGSSSATRKGTERDTATRLGRRDYETVDE
jgi:hypothetical protein